MTVPLRVGVIGAGNFGQAHLAAYARRPDVEIVAVADTDLDRARAAAEPWGISRYFAEGPDLIAACRPAGVSVVTPAEHHLAPALAALEVGCSVLLEKPIALSSDDAGQLAAAARASAAFVMPAHVLRFAEPYAAARDCARRTLGKLIGISTTRERTRDHGAMFPDVHPALMTLIHDIDVALWIVRSRAIQVTAVQRTLGDDNFPSLVWAHVEAADGSVWSLQTTWVLPKGEALGDRLGVFGSAGAIAVDLTGDYVGPALDAEIAHFCGCLRACRDPEVITLREATHGIEIAEAIMQSAAAGGVTIKLESDADG